MITLREYQENGVAATRNAFATGFKSPVLVLPTGGGKCLAPGTPVLMFDGSIRAVEKIKVGDLLMGPDSKPRRVLSTCSGIDPMYRITPVKGGDAFECNEPHILSLVCNADISNRFRKDQVYNISVKDYLELPKSVKHCLKLYRTGVEFGHQEANLDPYFLGLWLGDGTSHHPVITNMEPEIEEYLYNYAESIDHYIHKAPNGETRAWNYGIYPVKQGWNNGVRGSLKDLNLIKNKHIPKQYLINSRQQRLRLLAGLIDTDGYLHNNCYEIHVAHEQLGNDIIYLCRSLGFAVNVGRKVNVKGLRLGISGAGLEEIPCIVSRKKAQPRQQVKDALRTGFTVEALGMGQYHGFTIDGDHLFLLGDFTVTHNTICFSYICQAAAQRGKRVLILAHRTELIAQASRKLLEFGVDHGRIQGQSSTDYRKPVQVASVQTLIKRLDKVGAFDLIIIDEGHHAPAGTWDTIIAHFRAVNPKVLVMGVTATPIRSDGKGLASSYDFMVVPHIDGQSVTARWLMNQGFLSQAVVHCPENQVDLSGLRKGAKGDYTEVSAAAVMADPTITGDAVEHYRRYANYQPAIAFCASVQRARETYEAFKAAGYRAGLLAGDLDPGQRADLIDGLGTGKYHVLAVCDMVSEGTDIPVCSVAILMRPTTSLGLHLQQVGRVLRPVYAESMPLNTAEQRLAAIAAGPKPKAVVIDMVGNVGRWRGDQFVENLGFPDTEWEWSLNEDKPVKKRESEIKERDIQAVQCEGCYAFFRPVNPKCPLCGRPKPTKQREIIVTEGELREAIRAEKEAKEAEAARAAAQNVLARKRALRCKSIDEIKAIAKELGKDEKWAWAMWNVAKSYQR